MTVINYHTLLHVKYYFMYRTKSQRMTAK